MTQLLDPVLYEALLQRFGQVRVANVGVQATCRRLPDGRVIVDHWGECYEVCCPKCGDTRFRLRFSHLFRQYRFLVYCFNENCFQSAECRQQIWSYIFSKGSFRQDNSGETGLASLSGLVTAFEGDLSSWDPGVDFPVIQPPRSLVLLSSLPSFHAANYYLTARGFDVGELSSRYQVSYCESYPQFPQCQWRIFIPFLFSDRLVGWQARFVGERNWKFSSAPKYYHMPGFRKSRYLYNYDQARGADLIVVVEGVMDAWRIGPEAVAVMGHRLSRYQAELLRRAQKPVVLFFDLDVSEADLEKECFFLSRFAGVPVFSVPFRRYLVESQLPQDWDDPAALPRAVCWEWISRALQEGPRSSPSGGFQ